MNEITKLLKAWGTGDKEALDKLLPLVDSELRKIARKYMRNERAGNLLQTTALIHEALMKLIREEVDWECRKQFYGYIARRMRQVLVDYARRETKAEHVDVEKTIIPDQKSTELVLLDEALTKLAKRYERQARVIEYRYFIGLSIPEVAELLGVAPKTVERDWDFARSWLKKEMTSGFE